jgi:hypothetical protein
MKYRITLALVLVATAFFAFAQTRKTSPSVRVGNLAAPKAAVSTTSSGFTTFFFDWQYTANLPACVSTNTACYDGFILTNTTLGKVVGTQTAIGPGSLSYNYSPVGGVPYGTSAFSLVAHGFDANGAELTSAPATVSITVPVTSLNGPTNLQGTKQ